MYRNSRSKGIKLKTILQVCLLLAVSFWLIFQLNRSRDKNNHDDTLTTRIRTSDEIVKFGRKHLPPKLDQTVKKHEQEEEEDVEEVEEDNKHEEEEVEEEKIDEEKDDEIDENDQQQKSDLEIEREEVDIIDEDKENEEKEEESRIDNTVEIDEEHTHELREEHYKADDASSAVTHDGRLLGTENGTLDNSGENVGQENESEPLDSSVNPASSIDFLENGPPSNTTVVEQVSNTNNETKVETDEGETENLETSDVIEGTEETLDPDEVQHLEEKEVRTDLDTLPEIETEGGNSEDTAEE